MAGSIGVRGAAAARDGARMRGIGRRFALLLAGAGLGMALMAGAPAQAAEPIKVGASLTQTGPFSPPALFELQGYRLAVEEINAAGGVLGRPLALVSYDDQGNPSTAVQLYQKLITDDKVDLLLSPYQTDLTVAVAPIVNRAKIVMPALDANVTTYSGKFPYLVQAITQTSRYMVPTIDLAASRGYKTISLLVQNTQFPTQLAQGIEEEAKAKGMTVVYKESYPPTTTDFSALLLKAAQPQPDVIIGATFLADAMGIVRAAKAQNVQAKMFAFSIGPVEPEFYKGLGGAAEGVIGTTLYFPTLKTKGNEAFVKAFTGKFGRAPDYHAAVAYASLKVLAEAVTAAGSIDQDKIRAAILKTSEDTVAGHFELSPTGAQTGYRSYALQWQKSEQELIFPPEQATAEPVLPHAAWQ